MNAPDAVIVGGGPNGLAAAIELARARHSVVLLERAETVRRGLAAGPAVRAVQTFDLISVVYPARYAFWGAATLPDLPLLIVRRLREVHLGIGVRRLPRNLIHLRDTAVGDLRELLELEDLLILPVLPLEQRHRSPR